MTEPTPHFCDCGCGGITAVAQANNSYLGLTRGLSYRFIGRHHAWKGDDASYHTKHAFLRLHFPKSGRCEECGKAPGKTEYALIHGREYSRNREDYRELCVSCHRTYDGGGERHPNARLTDAIVVDMRRRSAAGETIVALAREYGVSQRAAWKAITGKSWRHLPMAVTARRYRVRRDSAA